ncbi:MAG: hypothetical protein JAY95_11695 [Candidatus Thiodiazotropha taylori]|nr:hypothetical protein [Candidatus Thiodiazotropha taylori]
MKILDVLMYAYSAGALVVALRHMWHMVFMLDRYDWQYNKSYIWQSFILSVLLWPIILAKNPGNLIDPSESFKEQVLGVVIDTPGQMRLLDQLRNNPPPCGPVIRYRQRSDRYEGTYGEFLFSAEAVETRLVKRRQVNQEQVDDEEEAVLNWLRQRDNTLTEPTDVPDAWWKFQNVADDLVREGDALVGCICMKCGKEVSSNELVRKDDGNRPGWNFNRLTCPDNHNLLSVEVIHLLFRSKV